MEDDDLPIRTVDAASDDGRRWFTAAHHAFADGEPDDTFLAIERRQVAELSQTLYAVWPGETWAPHASPVATYSSWTGSINTGAATVGLHMISDVTVAPTHRRRGLLRRLITADLDRAAAAGTPLAALTATEGSIYGRFGFGPATRLAKVEVDPVRFALRAPLADDPGHLELVPAADAWPAISAVADHHLATTRGAVSRLPVYEDILTGAYRPRDRGPDPRLRVALHVAPGGEPDGFAVFRAEPGTGPATLDVVDLLAGSAEVELRLWALLASTDLITKVTYDDLWVDSPLRWALRDPRALRTTEVGDHLWVRVLDVPAALAARPWVADGTVVLGVRDPLGHAEGTWRLTVEDGRAEVVSAEESAAEVTVDADTLGSLQLGDTAVTTLAAAGRLGAVDPAVLERLGALADLGAAPYCPTGF